MEPIFNDQRCVIEVIDGTDTTPITHEDQYDTGTLSVGPIKPVLIESEPVTRKGRLIGHAPTTRIFPEGSFEGILNKLSDDTDGTMQDFILGSGKYASGGSTPTKSTTAHADHIRTYDLRVTWLAPSSGSHQVLLMEDCEITIDSIASASPTNTISYSFIVYGDISLNGTKVSGEIPLTTLVS